MLDLPAVLRRAEHDARPRRGIGMISPMASFASTARTLAVAAIALAMVSCSYDAMARKFTPPDADARAREYLGLFAHRQTDAAMGRVVPQLQTPEVRQELAKITTILANQRFDSMKVIGAATSTINGNRHSSLTYEMHAAGGWFEATVSTVDSAGDWRVDGVRATSLPRPLESEEWFTLSGKSTTEYAWLLATILCPLIAIGTAIFIATRTQMPKRWRWVAMALVGLGTYSLNWTTGDVGANPASVQLLSGGYMRAGPYSPYIFIISFPLGAAVAIDKYRRWRRDRAAAAVITEQQSGEHSGEQTGEVV